MSGKPQNVLNSDCCLLAFLACLVTLCCFWRSWSFVMPRICLRNYSNLWSWYFLKAHLCSSWCTWPSQKSYCQTSVLSASFDPVSLVFWRLLQNTYWIVYHHFPLLWAELKPFLQAKSSFCTNSACIWFLITELRIRSTLTCFQKVLWNIKL